MSREICTHDKCKLLDEKEPYLPTILPNDSCWMKLKRKVWQWSVASPWHPETHNYLKSRHAIMLENRRQVKEHPGYSIHPLSQLRHCWVIFIYFVLFIHVIVVPFVVSFSFSFTSDQIRPFIYLDIVVCTILILEVPMGLLTGYIVDQNKEIVLERRMIIKRYMRKKFFIDVIGSLPYVVLLHEIRQQYLKGEHTVYIMYNAYIYLINLARFSQLNFHFANILGFFRIKEKCTAVLLLSVSSFYLMHWTSCLRYSIVNVNYFYLQYEKEHPDYIYQLDLTDGAVNATSVRIVQTNVFHNYVRSCFFTAKTALLAGNALEANDEFSTILISFFIIIGGFIWAGYCLFSGIHVMFSTTISSQKFEELYGEIAVYCRAKKLPLRMQNRLIAYYKHRYRGHYFNEMRIRSKLSGRLKREILVHTCHSLVSSVSLFEYLPRVVMEHIIDVLIFEIYLPNDIIVKAGTEGDAMFMISFGTAVVRLGTNSEISHLNDGDYFGEISILFENQRRIATVAAIEICEVYKLPKESFQRVIAPHENLLKLLREKATERMASSAKLVHT